MKSHIKRTLLVLSVIFLGVFVSCEDDTESCTDCPDDAPYGAVGGNCYATLSACENAESGNCVVCQ
ncbi:MAG: hypothetical protein RIC35_04430 [Marinoscillum sp.]